MSRRSRQGRALSSARKSKHQAKRRAGGAFSYDRQLRLEHLEDRCLLAIGDLDPTFGDGGKVFTNRFVNSVDRNEEARSVFAIQADGKIVVGGWTQNSTNTNNDFALRRYNMDGSLDMNFGAGGKVTTAFGSGNDEIYAITVHQGKIIAAGRAWNGSNYDLR